MTRVQVTFFCPLVVKLDDVLKGVGGGWGVEGRRTLICFAFKSCSDLVRRYRCPVLNPFNSK